MSPIEKLHAVSDWTRTRRNQCLRGTWGLTGSGYDALVAAQGATNPSMACLATQLRCCRGNLTYVMDNLERNSWIMRERSTEDRRVVNIRIPDDKAELLTEIHRHVAAMEAEWAAELAPVASVLDALAAKLAS